MAEKEIPNKENNIPESAESRRKAWAEFREQVTALKGVLGPSIPLPEGKNEEDRLKIARGLDRKNLETFSEMTFARKQYWDLKRNQIVADLPENEAPRGQNFDPQEYVMTSEQITYYDGLEAGIRETSDIVSTYEEWQDFIATLPPEAQKKLADKRAQAVNYMKALNRAMQERIDFTNAVIAQQRGDFEGRDAIVKRGFIGTETAAVLQKNDLQAALDHRQVLEEAIIGILSGSRKIEGVDQGFLPQYLLADVLEARYTQIQEQQKQLVRSGVTRNATEGAATMQTLDAERRVIMEQFVRLTNGVGEQQQRLSELYVKRRLFGKFDVFGASLSPNQKASKEDRKAVHDSIDEMQDFHLDRLNAMVGTAQKEFTPGAFETMRDLVLKGAVKSNELALTITKWIGKLDIISGGAFVQQTTDYLFGPISEGMGWPRDEKTGRLKEPDKLTPQDREAIAKKLGDLKGILNKFQAKNHATTIKSTTDAIKELSIEASVSMERIGQVKDLPAEPKPITKEDISAKLDDYEKKFGNREDAVATLAAVLLRQLKQEWGTLDSGNRSGTGFVGSYAEMLADVEDLIGVQFNLADSAFKTGDRFMQLAKIGGAGLAAAGIATLATGGVVMAGKMAVKGGIRAASAGTRLVSRLWSGEAVAAEAATARTAISPLAYRMQVLGRGAAGATAAYETYRFVQNAKEVVNDIDRYREAKAKIRQQLENSGFSLLNAKEPDRYVHNATGIVINLKDITVPMDYQQYTQWARTGVIATEAIGGVVAAVAVTNPVGWTMLGVGVVVEQGLDAYEKSKVRDFIAACPPWLLAAIGTSQSMKYSEYDMIANSTGEKNLDVRKKLYFHTFNAELQAFAPDIQRELFAGANNAEGKDEFFGDEFESFVLPYISTRMFQVAKNNKRPVTFEQMRNGEIDRGMFRDNDVTEVEIRRAVREAAMLTVAHLREKRFLEVIADTEKALRDMQANPQDQEARRRFSDLETLRMILGRQMVFGSTLDSAWAAGTFAANDGKTRAELCLAAMKSKAEQGSVDFDIDTTKIGGLPKFISFTTHETTLNALVQDPVDRHNIERLSPRGPKEAESATNDILLPRRAANFILHEVDPKQPDLPALSPQYLEEIITDGAIRLFEKEKPQLRANAALSQNGIPVFSDLRGEYDANLLTRLRSNVGSGPLQGIILQSKPLPSSGCSVILITALYGEAGDYYVVQNAGSTIKSPRAGTFSAPLQGNVMGSSIASSEAAFRRTELGSAFFGTFEKDLVQAETRRRTEAEKRRITAAAERTEKQKLPKREGVLLPMLDGNGRQVLAVRLPDSKTVVTLSNYEELGASSLSAVPKSATTIVPKIQYKLTIEGTGKTLVVTPTSLKESDVDAATIESFLTAPIDGDARGSILKILNLLAHDVAISKGQPVYQKSKLIDALTPIYEQAKTTDQRRSFLAGLLEQAKTTDKISAASTKKIIAWAESWLKTMEAK